MSGLLIWDRRPKETSKAFAAFVAYRDLPPLERSAPAAAKSIGGSHQQFTRWSHKHDWVDRAGAYDDFVDEHKRAANLDVVSEMAERQADAARSMQEIAIESLQRISEDMNVNPSLRLKEGNIMHFLTQGATMERVARGEPGAITEQQSGPVEIIWEGPLLNADKDAEDAPGPVAGPPE